MSDSFMSAPGSYGTNGPNGLPTLPNLNTAPISGYPGPEGVASPSSANSAGGAVRRAAPEPNKRALYVGGLDQSITEEVLQKIFETAGHVISVKIIPDKNVSARGLNYGFVEYEEQFAAERAMQSLNGRRVISNEIRVNWAYQSNNTNKEDTSNHSHLFVGDLSNEVSDEILLQAFSVYGNVSEARVMWDMKTGRSRGYGFVAFRDPAESDKALNGMNGEFLGSRAIRVNYANQKGQPSVSQQQAMSSMGMAPYQPQQQQAFAGNPMQTVQQVAAQAGGHQTNVYVGNLTPYTSQNDIIQLFSMYGMVQEARLQTDRGFAFVKMDTHENAANAIVQLNGYQVNGRPLKCGWGRDRNATASGPQFEQFSPQPAQAGFAQAPGYFPQYQQSGVMGAQAYNPSNQYQNPAAGYGNYQAGAYSRQPAAAPQYAAYGQPQQQFYGQQSAYGNGYQQQGQHGAYAGNGYQQ